MTIALIVVDDSENAMPAIDEILDTSKLHVYLLYVWEPIQINEIVINEDSLLDMLSIKKVRKEAVPIYWCPRKRAL